jgi:hypothetical protein
MRPGGRVPRATVRASPSPPRGPPARSPPEAQGNRRVKLGRDVEARLAQIPALVPELPAALARLVQRRLVPLWPLGIARRLGEGPGEEPVGKAGQEMGHRGLQAADPADDDLARGRPGGAQDGIGHQIRVIDRRRHARGGPHIVLCMVAIGRVNAARLDQFDQDRRAVVHKLEPERVREALHRVLGRGIGAQDRRRHIGGDRADIDQRAPARLQLPQRLGRAIDDAPVIGLEQALVVLVARVLELGVDPDLGIVDPGVEPAMPRDHRIDDAPHVLANTGYRRPRNRPGRNAARCLQPPREARPHCGRRGSPSHLRRRGARSSGRSPKCPGGDHGLPAQGFEVNCHASLLKSAFRRCVLCAAASGTARAPRMVPIRHRGVENGTVRSPICCRHDRSPRPGSRHPWR